MKHPRRFRPGSQHRRNPFSYDTRAAAHFIFPLLGQRAGYEISGGNPRCSARLRVVRRQHVGGQVKVRLLLALVCCLLIALPSLTRAALRPAESDEFNGQEAPAFSMTPVKGDAVSLKDFKGLQP